MNRGSAAHHLWHMTVMWYGLDFLPRLRRLSPAERMQVMLGANDHNLNEPLWLHPKCDLQVAGWGDQLLTGGQVMALILFGIWVQIGEQEENAPDLVAEWPELPVVSAIASAMR